MKSFLIPVGIICCPCFANTLPPHSVIQSCLTTESVGASIYKNIPSGEFIVDDTSGDKRTFTTLTYQKHVIGIWTTEGTEEFGLIYDKLKVPSTRIKKIGADDPTPFTPFTAQWGEARLGKGVYACITFNFSGIGSSGSLQNIRGLYVISMNGTPEFYYIVGDIRKFVIRRPK